jgi:hypothetical protein
MSIIVRGMKMPENCSECPVALSGKYCRINKTYTTYIKLPIRPDHCPLVELSEKHGRLIDADVFIEKMDLAISMISGMIKVLGAEDDAELQMELKSYRDIRDSIKEEPPIIEAEDSE